MSTSTATPPPATRPLISGSFGLLFAGQAVSSVGSQVTFLALPMIAVLTLHASPGEMGVLGALDNLPYLLLGLWVGVFVDRHARRRIMVLSDLLRAVAVVSVPLAFLAGRLSFAQLCAVAFVVGAGNIAFDVACQAQLPEIVAEDRLVDANGALQTTASLAGVGAPGLVGLLISLIGAPLTMLIDACSYVVSVVTILLIRGPEHPRPAPDRSTWRQVVEGLRAVVADKRLVGLSGGAAMVSIGMNAMMAVLVFRLAAIGMDALHIGLTFLAFGVGGAVGAVSASRVAKVFCTGRVMAAGPVVAALALVGLATVNGTGPLDQVVLFGGGAVMGAGLLAYQVLASGLRQTLAPERLRGRVLGTMRFVEWGSMPVGSLLGGAVGEWTGAVPAMLVSAVLVAACTGWTLASGLRSQP